MSTHFVRKFPSDHLVVLNSLIQTENAVLSIPLHFCCRKTISLGIILLNKKEKIISEKDDFCYLLIRFLKTSID